MGGFGWKRGRERGREGRREEGMEKLEGLDEEKQYSWYIKWGKNYV